MKSKRFSVEQIVSAIKQHESGLSVTEITRKMRIAEGTFYAWRDDYNKSRPHRALNNLPPLQFVASIEN